MTAIDAAFTPLSAFSPMVSADFAKLGLPEIDRTALAVADIAPRASAYFDLLAERTIAGREAQARLMDSGKKLESALREISTAAAQLSLVPEGGDLLGLVKAMREAVFAPVRMISATFVPGLTRVLSVDEILEATEVMHRLMRLHSALCDYHEDLTTHAASAMGKPAGTA